MKNKNITLQHDLALQWSHDGKNYCLHVQMDTDAPSPMEDDCPLAVLACFHPRHSLGHTDMTKGMDPDQFWVDMVRRNASPEDVSGAILSGKLPGIRAAAHPGSDGLYDIYLTTAIQTVIGRSEPSENLEYEAVRPESFLDLLDGDLTARHCMAILEDKVAVLPLWLYEHSGMTISCGHRVYPFNDRFDSSAVGWGICTKKAVLENWPDLDDSTWRAKAEDLIKSTVRTYDQYLTGEVYWFKLLESDGHPEYDTGWDESDSCGGFYGDDIIESGMAESVGCGLAEAIAAGTVRTGSAEQHTTVTYSFRMDG